MIDRRECGKEQPSFVSARDFPTRLHSSRNYHAAHLKYLEGALGIHLNKTGCNQMADSLGIDLLIIEDIGDPIEDEMKERWRCGRKYCSESRGRPRLLYNVLLVKNEILDGLFFDRDQDRIVG